MQFFVLCNSYDLGVQSIYYLAQQNLLAGVGIPKKHFATIGVQLEMIGIPKALLHALSKENLAEELQTLLNHTQAKQVLSLTFPWKIPALFTTASAYKFYNVHFGLLPTYKGADPVFWQLANKESLGGITIHLMNEAIDEGAVLHVAKLPIIPGETYGIHCARLGMLAVEQWKQWAVISEQLPIPTENTEALFYKKPSLSQRTIQWPLQTGETIEALVNACNPKYDGAMTFLKGKEIRLLEVSPADVQTNEQFLPGTIVHADAVYGIIVACLGGVFIKINVVHVQEGYLSGIKLFQMGFAVGDCFH